MGASKKDQYSEEQIDAARIGRAIAASARVAILQYIHNHHAATNKELSCLLKLAEPTVHQHLQVLVQSRFIEGNFFGDMHTYYFRPDAQCDLDKIDWILKNKKSLVH
jgi:DNA-binding transcriptional ArsR family regulator